MSELTMDAPGSDLTLSGICAENREGHAGLVARLRREVKADEDAALANHGAFRDALTHLTDADESNLAFYAMRKDHCEAGRLLTETLERIVKDRASEDAKEAICQKYGIDLDDTGAAA